MNTKSALAFAAIAAAALMRADAQAQVEPTQRDCQNLAALEVAVQNFETQDVNATLDEVAQTAQQVSAALDQIAAEAMAMSPAAFEQLKEAHENVLAAIDAVPDEATPEQILDRIASAKENERFAYQNLTSNIVCP